MRVYLAFGSNLGDREKYLHSGIRGLAHRGVESTRVASLYSTAPREIMDQPWFLNTAIEANTALGPDELLVACLAVEQENQRIRNRAKGPRTLDIDIIFYGSDIIRRAGLTVPHPSFSQRRFVLAPLVEIARDFVDPLSRKTVAELFEACPDSAEVYLIGRLQQPS